MYKQFMSKTAIKDNLPTLPFQQKMETYANLSSCSLISSTKLPPNYPLRILDTVLINLPRKKKKKKKKRRNSFDPIPRKRTTKFSPSVFFFPP